ncbi:PREDICTED: uncharacterized protein LOC103334450 [Prunus mume]|uniref:Uncharacterized protein LOC103334450 n=1 Tax=Prunus mume TaxID=102107 RepID=A0ABM0P805_PRUMU|nr:PREDICTED: uncharacterized protein LOC103334450 [Prunus mume]
MEELENRFGANLQLSDKELQGVAIGEDEIATVMRGSCFTLVARVLTARAVHQDSFVEAFKRLWKGTDEVSIREIDDSWFLVRFTNQRDMHRVLDMEPWTFKESLVLLAEVRTSLDARSVNLTLGTFWVQLHGLLSLTMTAAVARKIGSLIERVIEVEQTGDEDCIGHFLRVRIRIDVLQALMRGAFVDFPKEGSRWIDFRYEFIPEYCLLCGCLGHPSRVCAELAETTEHSDRQREERKLAFRGLEAEIDLKGRKLKSMERRSQRSNMNSQLMRKGSDSVR